MHTYLYECWHEGSVQEHDGVIKSAQPMLHMLGDITNRCHLLTHKTNTLHMLHVCLCYHITNLAAVPERTTNERIPKRSPLHQVTNHSTGYSPSLIWFSHAFNTSYFSIRLGAMILPASSSTGCAGLPDATRHRRPSDVSCVVVTL